MSIFSTVGSLLIKIGVTMTESAVNDGDDSQHASDLAPEINEWYQETLASETVQEATSNGESSESPNSEKEDENSVEEERNLKEKLEYLRDTLEVPSAESTHSTILDDFATESTPNQDMVGKLRKTLAEEDAKEDTVRDRLNIVFDYARIAEFFKDNYNKVGSVKRINTDSIDVQKDENKEIAGIFNDLLNRIHDQKTMIDNLEREVKQKETRINKLKQERDKYKSNFTELEGQVKQFINKVDDYIIPNQNYKTKNYSGKLSQLPELVKEGNIKSQPLTDLVEHFTTEYDTRNHRLTGTLIELLDSVRQGELNISEFETLFEDINNAQKTAKQVSSVDVDAVEKEANRLQSRAENLSGVVAEEIENELSNGKIRKIIDQKPDSQLIYTADKTLGYFESILDAIDKNNTVDRSVKEFQERIEKKRENYDHYRENRPGYNHNIQEAIDNRLQEELNEATEIASNGDTDEAKGRLYMIETGYDIIDTIYTDQRTLSVIETG